MLTSPASSLRKLTRRDVPGELAAQLSAVGPYQPVREVRFHPVRRWRFDLAYPTLKLAIECDGATWAAGRHTRGAGYAKDAEKYNTAVTMGWRVLRFTTDMVEDGRALAMVEAMFAAEAHTTAGG